MKTLYINCCSNTNKYRKQNTVNSSKLFNLFSKKNKNTGKFYMKIRTKCLLKVCINLEKPDVNINLAKIKANHF